VIYYEAVKQPEKAGAIESDLAEFHPAKPYQKSTLLQVQARAAELLGRKLDALMMYRSALEARPQPPRGGTDPLAENIDRLWKELGGTAATRPLFDNKQAGAQEANASRWERPKSPLPAFELSDFEGKNWKLADLAGKAVLINLWATWCGPCRQEHPEFQKLYEKLKGRPDVVVLAFNVDTDLSRVVPYIKENKYTFPSLAAYDFVRTYYPDSFSIPQNWLIDPAGKLEWIQTGYGSEPNWQETMLAKLQELLKSKQ
jgi:thiol-disulfide isomerase/thioredoxin